MAPWIDEVITTSPCQADNSLIDEKLSKPLSSNKNGVKKHKKTAIKGIILLYKIGKIS